MFERFTAEARAVVVDAQLRALRLGHNYIGCEHLLLAVAASDSEAGQLARNLGVTPAAVQAAIRRLLGGPLFESLDRDALAAIGIDLDAVRAKIEASFGPLPSTSKRRSRWRRRNSCRTGPGAVPFTPRAKKCLELTLREALALHDGDLRVEHLLLALARMTDGMAPDIFADIGSSRAQIRTAVLDRRRQAG